MSLCSQISMGRVGLFKEGCIPPVFHPHRMEMTVINSLVTIYGARPHRLPRTPLLSQSSSIDFHLEHCKSDLLTVLYRLSSGTSLGHNPKFTDVLVLARFVFLFAPLIPFHCRAIITNKHTAGSILGCLEVVSTKGIRSRLIRTPALGKFSGSSRAEGVYVLRQNSTVMLFSPAADMTPLRDFLSGISAVPVALSTVVF